jgi:DNA repair photolyase
MIQPANSISVKGRGTTLRPGNRFESIQRTDDWSEFEHLPSEISLTKATSYLKVYPKSIVNRVDSPDIPAAWSMNPYQGCEHGCIYCYARNTHEFWGLDCGHDFEQKILVKENAPELLAKQLSLPSWKKEPIMLSGNTDCYQPIEQKRKITRRMIDVCRQYRQPLGIITKNALVARDIDLLADLAQDGLAQVYLSITTLDEELRRIMEPRTSTSSAKLKTIRALASAGIPVGVMMAPVIPGINNTEIFDIAEKVKQAGASHLGYSMIRLNGTLGLLFEDWLRDHFPDRASKVSNLIKEIHGGQLNDSRFGTRMRGEGHIAESIHQQFHLAKRQFELDHKLEFTKEKRKHTAPADQLSLF